MRKRITPKNLDQCTWAGCEEQAKGRSKYCARHRDEAHGVWLKMIRERAEAASRKQEPRTLETGGLFFPSGYMRSAARAMKQIQNLESIEWGIVIDGNGVWLRMEGRGVDGELIVELEALAEDIAIKDGGQVFADKVPF